MTVMNILAFQLRAFFAFGVILILLVASMPAESQDDAAGRKEAAKKTTATEAMKKIPAKNVKSEMAIPDSSAFSALGITPEDIIRPATPQGLAAQLLNGVDANGNLQNGLAIETPIWLLLRGNDLNLLEYQEGTFNLQRTLARTKLSIATAKGASDDDKAMRFAVGLHLTPWDLGDPRLDQELINCFVGAFSSKERAQIRLDLQRAQLDPNMSDKVAKLNEKLKTLTDADWEDCNESAKKKKGDEARSRNWNRSAWSLGISPTWISTSGNTDDLEFNNFAAWTSLAYGFENTILAKSSQLLMSAKFIPEEKVPDAANSGAFLEQDTFSIAFQLRVSLDKEDTIILNADASYIDADRKNGVADDTSYKYAIGVDYKLSNFEDTYLKFSVGTSSDADSRNSNSSFVLGTLRAGF